MLDAKQTTQGKAHTPGRWTRCTGLHSIPDRPRWVDRNGGGRWRALQSLYHVYYDSSKTITCAPTETMSSIRYAIAVHLLLLHNLRSRGNKGSTTGITQISTGKKKARAVNARAFSVSELTFLQWWSARSPSQQPCGCPRCGAWQGCWSWP